MPEREKREGAPVNGETLVLRSLDAILGVPMPYIAAWHQAPVHGDDGLPEHAGPLIDP